MPINAVKEKEIHYTICPVGNASYIAAQKDMLRENLENLGVTPVLLQSLPQECWKAHFDYQDSVLFREGGNIPPLWAKSNNADVVLIGLTLLEQKQYILARADSPIDHVEQLRKNKIGIPVHPDALIDFHKASAEHGFEIALAARGVAPGELDFIELFDKDESAAKSWNRRRKYGSREAEALDSGEVDAIYVKSTRVQKLLDTGKYKVIFAIDANPEQLAPINNEYPNTLTVSRHLAENFPEVVVAYVKQLLLAAQWAKANRLQVLELFAEQTFGTPEQVAASHSFDFYKRLTPEFSEKSLQALEGQKRFLFDHGYLKKDFALEKWADDRFLKAAWAQIQADRQGESRFVE
jgi:sulfonate transport system substrate-binding protein